MVQFGRSRGRGGYVTSQLQVELSNEWPPRKQVTHQESRYVDSFAVSSRPHYVQPRSSSTKTTATAAVQANDKQSEGGREGGGSSSSYVASPLVECGVEHHSRGEYEKALKAFRAALNAQRLSLGNEEHLCIAHTLGNVGAVYLRQGRLVLAAEALEEALRMKVKCRIKEKDRKKSKISLADTLNNLGNIAYLQGDYDTSHKYYRATVKDSRNFQGGGLTSQKELANALHNIGRLYIHQKEWDAALSVLTECQRIEQHVYGPRDILLVDTLDLIGFIHLSSSSGSLDEAVTCFSDALTILRNVHRTNFHSDVASCLLHIGMVLEARGDLKDAWDIYIQARDIYVRLGLDFSHRGLKATRRSIATIENLIAVENNDREEESYYSNEKPIPKTLPSSRRFVPIEPELERL